MRPTGAAPDVVCCVHCYTRITFDYELKRWVDSSGFYECTYVFDGHRP